MEDLGYVESLHWPAVDKKQLNENKVDYVIQINGKKRAILNENRDIDQETLLSMLKKNKLSNKYVTVFFRIIKNKNKKKLNISFVTKKKIGNAVKRNKIKRRLKNIMNEAVKKISINFNYSYLIIAKSTMLNDNYIDIKEVLFESFKKIK